jgi:hypothetical protein
MWTQICVSWFAHFACLTPFFALVKYPYLRAASPHTRLVSGFYFHAALCASSYRFTAED